MSRGEFMLLSHPGEERFRERAYAIRHTRGYAVCPITRRPSTTSGSWIWPSALPRLLGAGNITGDATGGPLLKRIDESCTRAGLTFGIHNHYFKTKFAYESPEDVLRAWPDCRETVGATADVGQFASCGYDPVDAVRKLGPYLKLVHLKDIKAAGAEDNVLLGQGVAKIPEVMQELHKLHFGGLVAIEYEKEGPVEEDFGRRLRLRGS